MLYSLIGFFAISFVGCVLHFFYDWHKHFRGISFFVAVNESTWEHLKLGVFPTLIWIFVGIFFNINNLEFGGLICLLTIIITIPMIFYTYTHFTKKSILVVDILSFFVGVGLGVTFANLIFNSQYFGYILNIICTICIILLNCCFIIFTYFPPKIFLFKDPISNKYGIGGHYDDKRYGNNFNIKK